MLNAPEPASRRYGGKIADMSRWDAFIVRAGDIVVAAPPKSGTTWVQGIVAMLIAGDPDVDANVSENAPWLDINTPELAEVMGRLQAQKRQRQIKTHTPLDGIPIWSELNYISVFRHPIDVHFSFRKHVSNMKETVLADCFPEDVSEGFRIFIEGNHQGGASLAFIIDHYRSSLAFAARQNFLCLHYADMINDLGAAIHKIAAHVGISHPPDLMARLLKAATFKNMKANAGRFAVAAGQGFWNDDADFFDSATSNKWLGKLTDEDLAAYDARISAILSRKERRWLEWGGAGL